MKKIGFLLLMAFSVNVQAQNRVSVTNTNALITLPQVSPGADILYTIQSFKAKSGTWGYDILANGKVYFHQAEMPGKEGGLGFATETDALKAGKRIVELLRSPVSEPSLTAGELQNMGIR